MLGWDPITFWTSTHYDVATALRGRQQLLEENMVQQSYLASWLGTAFFNAAAAAFHGKRFKPIPAERFYRRPEPAHVVVARLKASADRHRAERDRLFKGAAKQVPAAAFRLGRLPSAAPEASASASPEAAPAELPEAA